MISHPTEVEQELMVNQDRFVWEAPSFESSTRGPRWYLLMTIATVFLVAYAIWTANFLFAFIILLIAVILILAGNEKPRQVLVQVGDNGIVWDGKLHLFQNMDRFSIIYQPPLSKVLYLEAKSSLTPRIRIPLENEDPILLREHLRQYVKEDLDLQDEHLSDILARLLKI